METSQSIRKVRLWEKLLSSPFFWVSFVLFGMGSIIISSMLRPQPTPLPVIGELPEFELIDQNNKPFSRQDLRGTITVANFIFTSCQSVCPMLTAQMAKLQKRVLNSRPYVRFISITVDPNTDKPEVLKEYLKKFGANEKNWSALSGDESKIHKLILEGFRSPIDKEKGVNDVFEIVHGEQFVVLDSLVRVRAYRSVKNDQELNQIIQDIALLLNSNPAPEETKL